MLQVLTADKIFLLRLTNAETSLALIDWAMLKPRYPLSECDVPQAASASTPSSASSPYTSTRSGLPAHDLTPNGTSAPVNSNSNPAGRKKKRFELDFVHLDPVLSVHMRTQSMSMLGRGVIEFIHPEEREREWYVHRL